MHLVRKSAVLACPLLVALACGGSNNTTPPSDGGSSSGDGGVDNTGQSCKVASDCYAALGDAAALKGAVLCLDRVPNGYCTHLCTTDADCCAIPGECRTKLKEVCAPFESTGQMMCFLSCEDADISASGAVVDGGDAALADPTVYCQTEANAAFGCRSTGGGAKNRKICAP